MALGPGVYDDVCTLARERAGGSVILIVLNGRRGCGFSAQLEPHVFPELPLLLEGLAKDMRADLARAGDKKE